ncbi:MAG TPA: AMP-binding protein [Steroidobacteraceae bacterium]|nr:AMP-binding protein [Steroidobacteraceae bacterium]
MATPESASETDPSAWLDAALTRDADRPFLTTPGGRRLSYRELDRESALLAAVLADMGVAPADRVALQVDKSPDAVVLYVACLRLGAVLLPLNTAYTPAELEYFLADARPRIAVVRPSERARLGPLARDAGCPCVETLGVDGTGSLLERARAMRAPSAERERLPADALAALLYTSGTTGRSKGAMLTRGNLASNGAALAAAWRFSADDVLLHALPLFHVHGLFISINTVLAAGASLLLVPKFDAAEVLRLLPSASVLMGVPTYYTRLLEEAGLDRRATAGMRLFVSGSAPLLPDTHRDFEARTGHKILERYGMTETLVNASNPYDRERRPGSVGPALPGVAIRVTDPATGAVASRPGAIGMLEVRGPNVFRGYWNDPEKTAASFTRDGFFVTGDLGAIDAAGYVQIVGRAKDLVISGGYNVYPKEVESELDALPGVIESAVIGLPHADLGEVVTAIVALRPGAALAEAEALAALGTRLARYKVPRRIVFVSELPRNTMGKVQKATLRATYARLYAR